MTTPSPVVAVVGPGAIGTTVAAALHERGTTPRLLGRTARAELRLETPDGAVITVPGPVETSPAPVAADPHQDTGTDPVDIVFLAVKATQTADAAPWLRVLCGPDTIVCALQNGVEQVESIAPLVPGSAVVPAVVWFPAEARSDGSVHLRAAARLTLPETPAARAVASVLAGTRCAVDLAADFSSVAWRKLLQNAAAGLMALSGRRSGMFRREDVGAVTLDYLRECLAVARAEGAVLADDVPEQILAGFRANPTDLGTSILADRVAGRPLEWAIRNGVVPRRARAHGIPTPIGDVVVPLLAAASDGPG